MPQPVLRYTKMYTGRFPQALPQEPAPAQSKLMSLLGPVTVSRVPRERSGERGSVDDAAQKRRGEGLGLGGGLGAVEEGHPGRCSVVEERQLRADPVSAA